MTHTVSTKRIIREMDAVELEDFILDKWKNVYGKNTGAMFMTGSIAFSEIMLCNDCYKQLTGKTIFTNLSEEFTSGYNELQSAIQSN